jgi:long-chain acyl-CoA synthetase
VLAPDATLDVDDFRSWAKSHLASYKVPRRIEVVDELPRNIVGKVLRRVVRTHLLDG